MSELVVSGLVRKRSEVAGEIAELERRLAKARHDLGHLDGALRVFGHEAAAATPDRSSRSVAGLFAQNERQRIIGAALCANPAGLTTPQLTEHIRREKGLEDDGKLRSAIASRLGTILIRLEQRGLVAKGGMDGTARLWRAT